ncbi:MAG: ABC transporter permease [Candidatus Eisenbacteria bacterium]
MNLGRSYRIAMREARGLLWSTGGGLIVGTFWAATGLIFMLNLFQFERGIRLAAQQASKLQSSPVGVHINDWVVSQTFDLTGGVLFIFFIPLLTMRAFAEERRTGNLELLMSQPLAGSELLLGKLAGSALALISCLSIFLVYGVVLGVVSTPDWTATAVGALGLLLLGILFSSIGTLLSVLTRSPIEAAVLTLGVLLLIVTGPAMMSNGPEWLRGMAEFLSVEGRFRDFSHGVFDLSHVAFFLGTSLLLWAAALRGSTSCGGRDSAR